MSSKKKKKWKKNSKGVFLSNLLYTLYEKKEILKNGV